MKKLFVLVLFVLLSGMFFKKNISLEPVSLETFQQNEIVLKKVEVPNASITTKNLTSFLKKVSIVKLEYTVPKLYQTQFSNWNFTYTFYNQSNEKGLLEIEKMVSNHFKKLGYQKEIETIYFQGLSIVSLEILGTVDAIEAFEEQIKDQ